MDPLRTSSSGSNLTLSNYLPLCPSECLVVSLVHAWNSLMLILNCKLASLMLNCLYCVVYVKLHLTDAQ